MCVSADGTTKINVCLNINIVCGKAYRVYKWKRVLWQFERVVESFEWFKYGLKRDNTDRFPSKSRHTLYKVSIFRPNLL